MNSVAKIVTENMKESMVTNKRWESLPLYNYTTSLDNANPARYSLEEELRKLKAQNEQLLRHQQAIQMNNNNNYLHQQQQQAHQIQMMNHQHRVSMQSQSHNMMSTEATTPVQSSPLPSGPPPPIPKKPEHLPPTKRITEMVIRLLRWRTIPSRWTSFTIHSVVCI